MFNEQKAAQIAAWFLAQAGGKMPHLKLMKLMYLADRGSMLTHGFPMTGDRFVSMPHGPVLTETLSHIDDEATSNEQDGWDHWISDKENHIVALARKVPARDDLDEISDADIEILEGIWREFGHMGKYQIRDYTHNPANCPEWKDPNGSSRPILYETVFECHGFTKEQARALAQRIADQDRVERALTA